MEQKEKEAVREARMARAAMIRAKQKAPTQIAIFARKEITGHMLRRALAKKMQRMEKEKETRLQALWEIGT
jgi:hypothetical protein